MLRQPRSLLPSLLCLSFAAAHYAQEHDLKRTALCLDPSSVQVLVRGDGSAPDEVVEAVIYRRLARSLREALATFRVNFEERASCAGSDGFVLLHLLAYHAGAGDETRKDDRAYTYTLSAQVGGHVSGAGLEVENVLPGSRYDVLVNYLYSEAETGESFQTYLPGLSEEMVRGLVAAWWEDNPAGRASLPAPLIGGLLALVTALLSIPVLRRLKHRRAEAAGSPG